MGQSAGAPSGNESFLHRYVPVLGKTVFRLGLSTSYGLKDAAGIRAALDSGMNYIFWNPRHEHLTAAVKDVVRKDRDRVVIATGPMLGYFAGSVRRAAENALTTLGTEYLDVLQLFWAGKMSFLTDATIGELVKLRESGKARAIGVSIHDRKKAGELAESSALNFFMIRYNAAHPGAESDIFPHLERRRPAVVAYTATSWRKLLRRPSGWSGPVATAGDCYRFCLTSPHIDVTLTGPRNVEELRANLTALNKGPLSAEEMTWIRELGKVVRGGKAPVHT